MAQRIQNGHIRHDIWRRVVNFKKVEFTREISSHNLAIFYEIYFKVFVLFDVVLTWPESGPFNNTRGYHWKNMNGSRHVWGIVVISLTPVLQTSSWVRRSGFTCVNSYCRYCRYKFLRREFILICRHNYEMSNVTILCMKMFIDVN